MYIKHFSSLSSAQSGNVAILMALAVMPIFAIIGFTVDGSRQSKALRHVQHAMDAAALTGARTLENATMTDTDVRTEATRSFFANVDTAAGDQTCRNPTVEIDRDEGSVQVSGTCAINSLFGDAFWSDTLEVGTSATAQASTTQLDVALMLDVSGSMSGAKLDALKVAAKDAASTLITERTGDRVRIGFATYATSVNAGVYANAVVQDWEVGDTTCVVERQGSARFSDAAPGHGRWLRSRNDGACSTSSLLSITSDLNSFNNGIDSLSANGYTAGHQGIAWAWYLISPAWSGIWPSASTPLPYGDPDNQKKAVILMTDGQFNMFDQSASNTSHSQTQSKNYALSLCESMRNQEVLVYTIAFQAPTSAETLLRDCADEPTRFYTPDNTEELKAAYQSIASQLTNLAITK